jgi:hypothetical protein
MLNTLEELTWSTMVTRQQFNLVYGGYNKGVTTPFFKTI